MDFAHEHESTSSLEGYHRELGAWPVAIDDFVDAMHERRAAGHGGGGGGGEAEVQQS